MISHHGCGAAKAFCYVSLWTHHQIIYNLIETYFWVLTKCSENPTIHVLFTHCYQEQCKTRLITTFIRDNLNLFQSFSKIFIYISVQSIMTLFFMRMPKPHRAAAIYHNDVIKWKHFNPPFSDGFSSQRPVTRSFDVFFDLRMNKQFSKQSKHR